MTCLTDFMYPMIADIYYPIIERDMYGTGLKTWVFDKSVVGNFTPGGTALAEDIKAKVYAKNENMLIGRIKNDIRNSTGKDFAAITNILITNIRNSSETLIYQETSGERSGKGTLYEIATYDPIVNPFGDIDYYKIILRRTENQGATD
jgi:hypothetical protein